MEDVHVYTGINKGTHTMCREKESKERKWGKISVTGGSRVGVLNT